MASIMIIYSWNILYRNRELDRVFDFIANTEFDIFCLQEVPETLLSRLTQLPYHIASRLEVERLLPNGIVSNHIVTLSKHPIAAQDAVSFPEYWGMAPLRTRLFVRFMPSRFFSQTRNRSALMTDITMSGKTVRVFNLHLILANPSWRLKEFEQAMIEHGPMRPSIVCGDFNILEKPHITPLNWILGGRMADAFFYRRERARIEQRFVEYELSNPLRGQPTHPFSRSQLDHILVSDIFTIHHASVLPDRMGSDHHPIRVEVA